jgi:protoporphyrin/coproporphyrin ferrochelatase
MTTAVLLLGFGEPETPTPESVGPFLERIFLANAGLEPGRDAASARARARSLAERRLPELLADYRRIGGSPLNRQVLRQAALLEAELGRRGRAVRVRAGMQFTDPCIPAVVEWAAGASVERVVALPVYPLSGPSTTMAALVYLRAAMAAIGWSPAVVEVAGWHVHPDYTALRAAGVRALCGARGLDLSDPDTRLVFSAHGTPIRYLEEGSRYDLYVADHCRRLGGALGVERWVLGFQNHANRPGVAWTEPGIAAAIRGIDARRIVVVPVSFMQEQSETLAELDLGLAAEAASWGLEFHRVPIPHDDPALVRLLADLVDPLVGGPPSDRVPYAPCRCRRAVGTVCLTSRC